MTILARVVSTLFRVYEFLILVRVVLSWVRPNPYRPPYRFLMQFLYRSTEPVLAPLRRAIPPIGGAVDISPVIALLLLELVQMFVLSLLQRG